MGSLNISIVDYHAGNLRSVQKALERSGANATITGDAGDILNADALVFPGQGATDASMKTLKSKGLVEPLLDFIASGKPFLGICLGLQLLLDRSEEGSEPGLGTLAGQVRRLPREIKIPHMGWNQVHFRISHPFLDGVASGSYFYFVHSYYADPQESSVIAGTTTYGMEFCSVLAWRNVVAVQFHPEKSGTSGLKLYSNFVQIVRDNHK